MGAITGYEGLSNDELADRIRHASREYDSRGLGLLEEIANRLRAHGDEDEGLCPACGGPSLPEESRGVQRVISLLR